MQVMGKLDMDMGEDGVLFLYVWPLEEHGEAGWIGRLISYQSQVQYIFYFIFHIEQEESI